MLAFGVRYCRGLAKNGREVWAKPRGGMVLDLSQRVVYRGDFQCGLELLILWYRGALPSGSALQEVFVRRFDDLCE